MSEFVKLRTDLLENHYHVQETQSQVGQENANDEGRSQMEDKLGEQSKASEIGP